MITALLAGALAIALPQQQLDTTFAVRPGGALQLDALNGAVTISAWERDAMRVRARHGRATAIEIDRRGSRVDIDARHHGSPQSVTYEITVPRSYNVEVEGVNVRITVDGIRGAATLENVEGAIIVRSVTGPVEVESVSGTIVIENVTGAIAVTSVNQAIRISGTRGNIEAETVNGSVIMRNVDAAAVDATTINGVVEYIGTVRDGGRYFLGTHNGRITMGIPEQANARVGIETHNGRVETEFPVRVGGNMERAFSFTLGTGSASIELESYNGTVNLVRPRGR